MQRIVWLTDIHLNFLPRDKVAEFLLLVAQQQPDAILLTGDIAESHDVCHYLREMAEAWKCPLYFVLGNHDFYHSSIQAVRQDVHAACGKQANMHYLTELPALELAPGIGLIGHDGWADARYGDFLRSYVTLYDYRLIEEVTLTDKLLLQQQLYALGDAAANQVREQLLAALEQYDQVYFITHVPPLLEACWHEGAISDSQWSPHFTCKAMGDTLLDIMSRQTDKQLTVLCGHTHGSGVTRPLENMVIQTGGAVYGEPGIVEVIEL